MSKAVPDGYHTVTASLTVKDSVAAIEFHPKAFGAVDDRSGDRWGLATHVEDPGPAQMAQRRKELFASMAKK